MDERERRERERRDVESEAAALERKAEQPAAIGQEPVLTGPGIINKANASKVAALAKKGTR